MKLFSKVISTMLTISMVITTTVSSVAVVSAATLSSYGGWHESAYAQWTDSNPAQAMVQYKKSTDIGYTTADTELIRAYGNEARVDIPGLEPGTYDIKITTSTGESIIQNNITVDNYDRSGYAHFNNTEGVGAYNDDGTLKDNTIVLYVTDENKDTVSITDPVTNVTVTGIGNILNGNSDSNLASGENLLMKNLADCNIPLAVRIVGKVTVPAGTTDYNSTGNGGTKGDNGCMARIRNARNVTIEGIGHDAQIYGWGIHFMALESGYGKGFEVRNITFDDYPEDALGMEGVMASGVLTIPMERAWIHNNSFLSGYSANPAQSDKAEGDGSCDFKRGQYYTLSYNYFEDCHKTNLIGAGDNNPQFHITMHHNWWNRCGSRGPLARQANIHMYNNYYNGNSNTTQDARAKCYILSEANYLESCKNPYKTKSGAVIKTYKDVAYNCTGSFLNVDAQTREQSVSNSCMYSDFDTNPDIFYYDPDTKTSNVEYITDAVQARADCIAYSGAMKEVTVTPDIKPVISSNPTTGISIPYTIDYSTDDARTKMKAAGVNDLKGTDVNVDNILYSPTSSYTASGSTAYLKYKGAGIVFKLDSAASVSVTTSATGKYGSVLLNNYGQVMSKIAIGSTTTIDVPAGIYVIQCENADKECYIAKLSIDVEGTIPPTSETTTETTTASIYVADGTYNIGTDNQGANDCTSSEGSFGNIDYDLVSIDADGGKLLKDGSSSISFIVDNECELTATVSGMPISIIAVSGSVDGQSQAEIPTGTNTVKLSPGSYTLEATDSSEYSVVSQLKFETIVPPTTESTTETTTEGDNYVLNGTDIADGTVSVSTPCGTNNFFTLTATDSKVVKVGKGTLQMQGAGTAEFRSVLFTMPRTGKVTVTAVSSGSERTIVVVPVNAVKNNDGTGYDVEMGRVVAVDKSADPIPTAIDLPAGEYYITSLNGGVNISQVAVALEPKEDNPSTETTTDISIETTTDVSTVSTETTTDITTETTTEVTNLNPLSDAKATVIGDNGLLLVASIDGLNYREVGFILEANGKTVRRGTSTVYGSIDNSAYGLSDLGGNHMFSFTITDIDGANLSTEIKVTPYAITQSGEEILSDTSSYSVNPTPASIVDDVTVSTGSLLVADIKEIPYIEEI